MLNAIGADKVAKHFSPIKIFPKTSLTKMIKYWNEGRIALAAIPTGACQNYYPNDKRDGKSVHCIVGCLYPLRIYAEEKSRIGSSISNLKTHKTVVGDVNFIHELAVLQNYHDDAMKSRYLYDNNPDSNNQLYVNTENHTRKFMDEFRKLARKYGITTRIKPFSQVKAHAV